MECHNKSKVVTCVAVFLLAFTATSYFIVPVKVTGSVTVSKDDETVTVTNDLVRIVFTRKGVRPIEWTDLATGLELAKNAQPAGAIGKKYPLWDWIPKQDWPGEICINTYGTNATSGTYTGSVTISFNYTCTQSPIAGLQIIKVLTFYQDKYYFDMKVILRNPTGASIGTVAGWDSRVGYNINAVGYLEPLSDLYQGYQDGLTPYLDLNLGWNRRDAKELRWAAVYNKATGAIIALALYNATSSVWLEGARGAWGSETRVEYPPVTIAPNKEVAYVLKVYGGPPDLPQLTEIDMSNLAMGMAFRAEMDSDRFVYSQNDTCNYIINLTNSLSEDLTDVDVNVTFRESDQYETLGKKIFDVYYWTGLTVGAKSILIAKGNVKLTSPSVRRFGIYCLYAQVYQEGKPLTSLVLLIPVVSTPLATAKPLTVCLVWNLHQPYYMDPQGRFWESLAQDYVDEGNRPYLWHMLMLKKHSSINVTFNLQPSLLCQWEASAYNNWMAYEDGQWVEHPPSEGAKDALEGYADLAATGQIELLASPYYHPIMPILMAKNWTNDMEDQLQMGREYVQTLTKVSPTGLWVPEMAFNMSLVPIINDTGLQYIVLDHRMLESAVTLSAPSFEPWYVMDPKTNKTVIAFFRARFLDQYHWGKYDICNRLSTEFSTSGRPSEAARQFIACLFEIWRMAITTSRVVTVALDEWVSTGGPVANKTLENIYSALQQCSYWIKTKTLKSALMDVPPIKAVTNLLEGSWINITGLDEWTGPPGSNKYMLWNITAVNREKVMEYAESLPADQRATDPRLRTALKYIYIAETSDWYEQADEELSQQQVRTYAELAADTTGRTSPTTTHDYEGLWHTTDFTINLTATDDLSGVAETYYKINDGPTKTVSVDGHPRITTEGANNTLEYWSVDNAGNEELHKILTGIKLDKTAPTANAGSDQTVKVGRLVIFNASGSSDNVSIVSYEWDFGDGTTGAGLTTNHTYTELGTYNVTLTVKDAAGNTDTDSLTVIVEAVGIPLWIIGVIGIVTVAGIGAAIAIYFLRVKKTA